MSQFQATLMVLVVAVSACFVQATDQPIQPKATAEAHYESGKKSLKKSDFKSAVRSYGLAVKADPENKTYRVKYFRLRSVVKMRQMIEQEKDSQRWWKVSLSLCRFYSSNDLSEELLKLTQQIHTKRNTPQTAVMLGQAYLKLNQNEKAQKILSSIAADKQTFRSKAFLGIALARQPRTLEKARDLITQLKLPDKSSYRDLYILARLQTLTGQKEVAITTLTTAFSKTKPSLLPAYKKYVLRSPDFKEIIENQLFVVAMKTESTVPESSCSGGSSCGSCAKRSSCGTTKPGTDVPHNDKAKKGNSES